MQNERYIMTELHSSFILATCFNVKYAFTLPRAACSVLYSSLNDIFPPFRRIWFSSRLSRAPCTSSGIEKRTRRYISCSSDFNVLKQIPELQTLLYTSNMKSAKDGVSRSFL